MEATRDVGRRDRRGEDETGMRRVVGAMARFAEPAVLLRLEGGVLLALSVLLYWLNGESWLLFVSLLLAPDVSALGYLAGPRVGATLYNAFHTYSLSAALAAFGLLGGGSVVVAVALVWFTHIAMDRLLGYGLKHPTGFKVTHLGRL
jgi:uncharacterized protein YjeT (DUF2065 family)